MPWYPWRDDCWCNRACLPLKRRGAYVWVRCPGSTGPADYFSDWTRGASYKDLVFPLRCPWDLNGIKIGVASFLGDWLVGAGADQATWDWGVVGTLTPAGFPFPFTYPVVATKIGIPFGDCSIIANGVGNQSYPPDGQFPFGFSFGPVWECKWGTALAPV